jgi:hypothetical protein
MTDARGEFSLEVIVHDTDSIELIVTAQGFMPDEERLVGFDLVAGRTFHVGLTRVDPATASPP